LGQAEQRRAKRTDSLFEKDGACIQSRTSGGNFDAESISGFGASDQHWKDHDRWIYLLGDPDPLERGCICSGMLDGF
jgi:hypothetical protein